MDEHDAADNVSQWHSIRPWSPRFLLTVREITSVSATFLLSSTLNGHSDPSLASLGLTSSSDDEDTLDDTHLISETLSKSLSVNVNGAPWKRFLMRMDDEGDEAIIILYGLMPGRQYDIELGVTSGEGEEIIHSQMITQVQDRTEQGSSTTQIELGEFPESTSTPSKATSPSASTSPGYAPATSPPRTITIEERTAQLRHQLAQLGADRDALTGQLKAARKDAQKADALLRGEIDGLRRASEKYAPAEHRARQKVLALQEAVKQTLAATTETEALVRELEDELPMLQEREGEVEREHMVVQDEARRSKEECDEAVNADKKRVGELQGELNGLGNRLDKLTGKKEKLANETIPELEEQLAKLARDIELVERDSHEMGFDAFDNTGLATHNQSFAPRHGIRPLQPPAPIGSQRPTYQHQPKQQLGSSFGSGSSVATSARIQYPSNTFQQSPRSNMSGPTTSTSASILSSRAPPFDPTFRIGHRTFGTPSSLDAHPASTITSSAFSTSDAAFPAVRSQINNLGISSNSPYTSPFSSSTMSSSGTGQFAHSSMNVTTQRLRPSPPLAAHAPLIADSLVHAAASNSNVRPGSPVRQSSLPLNMPSFAQASPSLIRQRNVVADI